MSVVIGTDYIDSCNSNHHTITTTTAPVKENINIPKKHSLILQFSTTHNCGKIWKIAIFHVKRKKIIWGFFYSSIKKILARNIFKYKIAFFFILLSLIVIMFWILTGHQNVNIAWPQHFTGRGCLGPLIRFSPRHSLLGYLCQVRKVSGHLYVY